ncbi:Lrp/AsnC family transcriptional regulator [Aestuariispira insulae]|uniref:AsnC family transcriptional regulator n=1 Tax=Aestuariispira insulae TaxID=1461337 RepID=A0A3D9HW93_9PROT|nr:Lrp/AsnC family transcriptional regulator [Aestuariispira insulae]RED53784.1 AsnC family transcriptional regulator [Aestuariispira insulae]
MSLTLDAIDKRILKCLQKEGRITNAKLAEEVGLSAAQCLRRMRRLEDEGVIDGYSARLNLKNLGLGITALIIVKMANNSDEGVKELRRFVESHPEIIECHGTTGPADYILRVVSPDIGRFATFLANELSLCKGLEKTESHILMENVKENGPLPL